MDGERRDEMLAECIIVCRFPQVNWPKDSNVYSLQYIIIIAVDCIILQISSVALRSTTTEGLRAGSGVA